MIVLFPDGSRADIVGVQGYNAATSASAPVIAFATTMGTPAFYYTNVSYFEQIDMLYKINQAFKAGQQVLELYSFAPLPTNANTNPGDLFVNAVVGAAAVSINGNQRTLLTLAKLTAGWPAAPFNAATPNCVKSFQPDAKVVIGSPGTPVLNLKYVNGLTLSFFTPAMAAGTYGVTYSDGRGSVTMAGAFTFS